MYDKNHPLIIEASLSLESLKKRKDTHLKIKSIKVLPYQYGDPRKKK